MHSRPSTAIRPLLALTLLAAACAAPDVAGPNPRARPLAAAKLAAARGSDIESIGVVPVTFDLHKNTCGLTADVHGEGEMRGFVRTTTGDDGRELQIAFHNTAHGTATGADGSRYVFNYTATRQRINYTGAPPLEVRWRDHFHLIGRGGAPDIHTFFNIYFVVGVDGSRTYLREVRIGDADNCDPI